MDFINVFFPNLIMFTVAYLTGAVLWAKLFSKWLFKKNIEDFKSKNPGAANIGRNFGVLYGVLVWFFDAGKTVLVMLLALILAQLKLWANFDFFSTVNVALVGFVSIIGHVFPVYHKFKGGKGFSPLIGLLLFYNNWFVLYLIIIYPVFVLMSRIISVSSIGTAWTSALFTYIPGLRYDHYIAGNPVFNSANPWWAASLILIVLSILITWTHRKNIIKLINHEENLVHTERFWNFLKKQFTNEKKDSSNQKEDLAEKKLNLTSKTEVDATLNDDKLNNTNPQQKE